MTDQLPPDHDDEFLDDRPTVASFDIPEPPHPINWNLLTANDLEAELLELNRWVDWLRHTYGLPASVIPPYWHRHPELVWELSALHLHWLCAYDRDQNGSAPLGWHRDFADARHRLRDWVATSGTRLARRLGPAKAQPHRSKRPRSQIVTRTSFDMSLTRSLPAPRQKKRSMQRSTPGLMRCDDGAEVHQEDKPAAAGRAGTDPSRRSPRSA